MRPGTDTLVRLAHVGAELRHDLEALDKLAAELADLHARWPPSRAEVVMAATWVHGWYTGLETALERVAALRIEVPGVRPAVVPNEAVSDLTELRKFRHFFRNADLVDFDPARIDVVVARVLHCHAPVRRGLDELLQHTRAVAKAIVDEG